MFAATLLRDYFPGEAPTPRALFELRDPTVHQSEPLHSSRVSSRCWTAGKHHLWGKLSPRWAGWPDSLTPHCHQNQREGSSEPVWQGTEERSQDTHTAQVHSYTRLVIAWQVPYEQSSGEPGERTIGNGLKRGESAVQRCNPAERRQRKGAAKEPNSKERLGGFQSTKSLGIQEKDLHLKLERNEATLPTSRSVERELATAFGYGWEFREVPKEGKEGHTPYRMNLYSFHTPRVQDSCSFQNSYA